MNVGGPGKVSRRGSLLVAVVLIAALPALVHAAVLSQPMATDPVPVITTGTTYQLTQGGVTSFVPVLESPASLLSFYDYFSASSHTGYETPYESKVFLYRSTTNGEVGLIVTHNIDRSTSGIATGTGGVDFDFSGIPSGAYVAVSDDPSHCWDPPRCVEFSLAYALEGHWMYTDNTDGGVLAGLPVRTSWAITIAPSNWLNLNSWVYHGISDSVTLDMTQPVTIAYVLADTKIAEGGTATFDGFFDDPDAGDDHTVTWDFGDGTTVAGTFSPGVGATHHEVDPVAHTYGDDGVYTVTLKVEDGGGGVGTFTTQVVVANAAPTVSLDSPESVERNVSLRIAGEKWHDVRLTLARDDGSVVFQDARVRTPGNPDEQRLEVGPVAVDFSTGLTATVVYTPEDDPVNGRIWGATPVWLVLADEGGNETRVHHTFNVHDEANWTWTVDLAALLSRVDVPFAATATDPGSDDLSFEWSIDGAPGPAETVYNDGSSPDPPLSPGGTFPFTATSSVHLTFPGPGTYVVRVVVRDDNGGSAFTSVTWTVG